MLKNSYFISKIKQNTHFLTLNSINEELKKVSFSKLILSKKPLQNYFFNFLTHLQENREVVNCVYKDMLGLILM